MKNPTTQEPPTTTSTPSLPARLAQYREQIRALREDRALAEARHMAGACFVLPGDAILALPRDEGESRYPYGHDGFNLWVYGSGYIHGNEGLLSTFLRATRGQEPNAAFFLARPQAQDVYRPTPLLPVPRLYGQDDTERVTVFTSSAAYFLAEPDGLACGVRVFVTREKDICFSIHVANHSRAAQRFLLSSYLNPYLRHQLEASDEDDWFKQVELLPAPGHPDALPSFLLTVHEDKDRHTTFTNTGLLRRTLTAPAGARLLRHEETTSRRQYVGGIRGGLHTPTALAHGTFGEPRPLCTFTETAVMADILEVELEAGAEARMDMLFSMGGTREDPAPVRPADLDTELAAIEDAEATRQAGLRLRVGPSDDPRIKPTIFNGFLPHLKKQVEFCSLLKGYVQLSKNSLIGIRDIFQAIEGLLLWQPAPARAKMLEALAFTAPDGRCFRQYSLPTAAGATGRMDLRPFIDQGAWVISTIHTYLNVTGDRAFLATPCGYHEIVDEAAGRVSPANETGSVLQHLIRILDYLLRHRDPETGCVRALYGDWNDALDGLGIRADGKPGYGSGVSVMATLQVYQNAREMQAILRQVDAGGHKELIARYDRAASELEEALLRHAVVRNEQGQARLLHGWGDQRSYLVGGFHDPDGQARDGLTSNAFWVLSGLCRKHPEFRDTILDAFKRLDSKYGLRTFAPAFPPDTPGVGRIPKLPPGTAENGAAYLHATAFGIMALFQLGRPREAWEQLVKILPFTGLHTHLSHSPFVMPNSYGYNPEKFIDGQSMNDWQTGSSNLLLKLLVRFVLGFEPELDGLRVQPAAWTPFREFDFAARLRDCEVAIHYEKSDVARRLFIVNSREQHGEPDEMMGIDRLWIPAYSWGNRLSIHVLDPDTT